MKRTALGKPGAVFLRMIAGLSYNNLVIFILNRGLKGKLMMLYEWDEAKRTINRNKHGVDFCEMNGFV